MNTRIPCCATQDLDRYLDQQSRAEQRSEDVEARCKSLMAPGCEFCPTDPDNLAEAITEAATPFWIELAGLLDGDPAPVVACINAEADRYWAQAASVQAESDIDAERENAAIDAAERRNEDRRDYEREGGPP